MSGILCTLLSILYGLIILQDKKQLETNNISSFLPNPKTQPSKNAYEYYTWKYTIVWILSFGCIVAFQLYESFESMHYNIVCITLSLPFLLQPILYPKLSTTSPEKQYSPDAYRPVFQRYSFKANLWIAIFSFIGNYWYTHYFYSVLKAEYTFLTHPSNRLNNVPIALFFATHFYFSTYHALSNYCLRMVEVLYQPGFKRNVLFGAVIIVLSYITAFMESLTISSFPYYSFEDRFMAYTTGSAFYGIYFIISFPMFYFFDEDIDKGLVKENGSKEKKQNNNNGHDKYYGVSIWRTIIDSCACGMIVLCLLDFVRLYLDIPLSIGH